MVFGRDSSGFPSFRTGVALVAGQLGLCCGVPWLTLAFCIIAALLPVRRTLRNLPLCLLLGGLSLLPLQAVAVVGLQFTSLTAVNAVYAAAPLPLLTAALLTAVRDEFCRAHDAVLFTAFTAIFLSLGLGAGILMGGDFP